MRTRLLVGVLVTLLVGCGGGTAPPSTPTPIPTPSPTPYAANFEPYLSEYLDPAWTGEPIQGAEDACEGPKDHPLGGYINGKLIVVDADRGEIVVPGRSEQDLPWADAPSEVGTVAVVHLKRATSIKLVDFEKKVVVGETQYHDQVGWPTVYEALRSRLLVSPFYSHLDEYLAKKWTSRPTDKETGESLPGGPKRAAAWALDGYIRGGLIIVAADTREILSPLDWPDPSDEYPPDFGLPFADTPEEVGTLVLVWPEKEEGRSYWDGGKEYYLNWKVRLIDFEKKKVLDAGWAGGGGGPSTKFCRGDIGWWPWWQLIDYLRELPRR